MDIDLFKSTQDDQIEMMLMTMHMDKPAATSGNDGGSSLPYVDNTAIMSFNGGGGVSGGGSLAQHFNSSPTFLNAPQATISFSNHNNNNNNNNNNNSSLLPSLFPCYSNENGPSPPSSTSSQKQTSMAAMREMIFRIAAMQPIYIDPEAVKPPKRRNVKISKDPQSIAARHRRERISERIRILQRLVPGGTKMDTASMLDEAIHYVKFLKSQVQTLERSAINNTNNQPVPPMVSTGVGFAGGYSFAGHQLHMNVAPQHYSDSDA